MSPNVFPDTGDVNVPVTAVTPPNRDGRRIEGQGGPAALTVTGVEACKHRVTALTPVPLTVSRGSLGHLDGADSHTVLPMQ
ncbi:hypothetical protein [Pedococcus sp. 5OH_020]|uniref:hypothetical protein n=1 Tax=Pedococcus sp. 5OH_020 TaxID=2989814 RepID=UPI0022E9CE1A|nr:hypothetical protein [Pedococcus sp. 5OH_020]